MSKSKFNNKERCIPFQNKIIDDVVFGKLDDFDACVFCVISSRSMFCISMDDVADKLDLSEDEMNGYVYQAEHIWLDEIKDVIYKRKGTTSKVEHRRNERIIYSIASLIKEGYLYCEYQNEIINEVQFLSTGLDNQKSTKGECFVKHPFTFYSLASEDFTLLPTKYVYPIFDYFDETKNFDSGVRSGTSSYYVFMVMVAYRKIAANKNGNFGYLNGNEFYYFRSNKTKWADKDEVLAVVGMEYKYQRRFDENEGMVTTGAIGFIGDDSFEDAMIKEQDRRNARKEKRRLLREAREKEEQESLDRMIDEQVNSENPNNKELVGGFSKELIRRVCVGPQMYNDRDYENRKRLEAIKDKEKVRMEIENLFSGNREIFEAYAKDHPEVLTEGKVKTDVEWNGEYVRYLSYIYLYFKK